MHRRTGVHHGVHSFGVLIDSILEYGRCAGISIDVTADDATQTDDHLDHVEIVPVHRKGESRETVAIVAVQLGTRVNESDNGRKETIVNRTHESCGVEAVLDIHIRASRNQDVHDVQVFFLNCAHQRRRSVVVGGVDVCAAFKQRNHRVGVPIPRRQLQWNIPLMRSTDFELAPSADEGLDGFCPAFA